MKLTVEQYDAIEKCVNKILENRKLVDAPKEDPEAWRKECRKKQAAGVKYECQNHGTMWTKGNWTFTGPKEIYREEAPQEPHAAERALWKAQREAGTNEVWQFNSCSERGWIDIPVDDEPIWMPNSEYRVKPIKLTARIIRRVSFIQAWLSDVKLQDWEFTGTREEYRAECEKYGYVVVSEITEVKPKTVKYYFALFKTPDGRVGAESHQDKQRLRDWLITCCYTIIGDIEDREVEL